MNTHEPFLLISAEKRDATREVNSGRTRMLKGQLKFRGINFKEVLWSGKNSFLCLCNDGEYKFDSLLSLARRYGQRKVLYSDSNRHTTVLLLNTGSGGPHILYGETCNTKEVLKDVSVSNSAP